MRGAFGGLLASYRARLTRLRCLSARASLRYVGTIGVLLVVIGLALEGHASGQTEPLHPVFRPRLRCGTVSVPRSYENPGAGRFKLAVIVVRSAQQPAFPDPVVHMYGPQTSFDFGVLAQAMDLMDNAARCPQLHSRLSDDRLII